MQVLESGFEAWFTYIVQCNDDTLYTGITNNIEKRLEAHNKGKGGAKYTRSRRPVTLVFYMEFKSKSDAAKEEYRLKQLSLTEKQKIIKAGLLNQNSIKK